MKSYQNAQLINQITFLIGQIDKLKKIYHSTNIEPSLDAAMEFLMLSVTTALKSKLVHVEKHSKNNNLLLNFHLEDIPKGEDLQSLSKVFSFLASSGHLEKAESGRVTADGPNGVPINCDWIKSISE